MVGLFRNRITRAGILLVVAAVFAASAGFVLDARTAAASSHGSCAFTNGGPKVPAHTTCVQLNTTVSSTDQVTDVTDVHVDIVVSSVDQAKSTVAVESRACGPQGSGTQSKTHTTSWVESTETTETTTTTWYETYYYQTTLVTQITNKWAGNATKTIEDKKLISSSSAQVSSDTQKIVVDSFFDVFIEVESSTTSSEPSTVSTDWGGCSDADDQGVGDGGSHGQGNGGGSHGQGNGGGNGGPKK